MEEGHIDFKAGNGKELNWNVGMYKNHHVGHGEVEGRIWIEGQNKALEDAWKCGLYSQHHKQMENRTLSFLLGVLFRTEQNTELLLGDIHD